MKKLNILSKTDGWSSGHTPVTLGATVGSPSVHRRGTLLKLLSMLVLMVFGFGQVWATEETATTTFANKTSGTWAQNQSPLPCEDGGNSWNASATVAGWDTNRNLQFSCTASTGATISLTSPDFQNTTIKEVSVVVSRNKSYDVTLAVTVNGSTLGDGDSGANNAQNATLTTSSTTGIACGTGDVVITLSTGAPASKPGSLYVQSISVTYETSGGGGGTKPTVSFSPEAGTFCEAQNVTLSSVDGATIYYTTNGSEPTTSSSVYNNTIAVSATTTIRAFATKDNVDGDEVSATYTITAKEDPTITFNNGSVDEGYTLDLSTLFSSNSEGAVTYSITAGGSYATLSGSTLSGVAEGSVTVQASQAADGCYNAKVATATITVQEHVVAPGKYTLTLANALWGTSYTSATTSTTQDALDLSGSSNDIQVDLTNGTSTYMYITDTQTRAYSGYTLTFSVPSGFNITKIEFTKASKWGLVCASGLNADADTWEGEASSVEFTFSARTDMTSVDVTYEEVDNTKVMTLESIAVTGMTTTFEVGDAFSFDGKCTATYSVTKGGEAQLDETKDVTPTSVTGYDMSTAGEQTVTVTYEEGEVTETTTYTITVNEHEVTAGEYTIIFNNALFGTTGLNGSLSGTDLKDYSGTKYDITIDYKKGTSSNMYLKDSEIRLYSGNSLVVTAPTGFVITKVDKLVAGINADKGEIDEYYVWTGEGSAVTFSKTGNGGLALNSFKVTYAAVDPTAPAVSVAESIDDISADGVTNQVLDVSYTNIDLEHVAVALFNDADYESPFTDGWLTVTLNNDQDIVYTLTENSGAARTAYIRLTVPASNGSGNIVKRISVNQLQGVPTYSTLDAVFAAATTTDQTVKIAFDNCVITGKKDAQTAYLTDKNNTYGLVIFTSDHGFEVGDVLNGTVRTTLCKYQGNSELKGLNSTSEGLTVSTGGTVTARVVSDPNALTGANTGSVIKVTGSCTKETKSQKDYYYINGVQLFDGLSSSYETPTVSDQYHCTGVFLMYNAIKEIMPRVANELEHIDVPTAVITFNDFNIEKGQSTTLSATVAPAVAASANVTYSIVDGGEYVSLDDAVLTANEVGTAHILATVADNLPNYYGATKQITVEVLAPDTRKQAKDEDGFEAVNGNLNADIAYASFKGDGTGEPNVKDHAIQLYQIYGSNASGGYITFTAVQGCKIDQVKITTAKNATHIAYAADGGDLSATTENVAAGDTYLTATNLDAQNVSIYCMHNNSSYRLFVATAVVYYTGTPATVESIALSGEYPTIFGQGEAFSHEGMTVTATYSDNSTADVTDYAEFTGYDMDAVGEQTVTVSFGGKTATYGITVNAATVTDLTLTGNYPTRFSVGDEFSHAGMTVTANYSNSTSADVTADATFGGYNMSAGGIQTVTVEYEDVSATYSIIVVPANTDVMVATDLVATNTQYKDFSGVTDLGTDAIYAGTNAKNDAGAIQLRTSDGKSGIVVTTANTGKIVKSVSIAYQTAPTNERKLQVYGKHTAYASAADLYGEAAGMLIGQISADGSLDCTTNEEYEYIGLRSSDGAIYVAVIMIEWADATPATYDVTYVSAHGSTPDAETASSVTLVELTEEGWTHNGWVANVDVEVDAETVTAGTLIANGKEVILSAATEFTADWTENSAPDYGSYQRDQLTAGRYGTICLPNGGTIEGATLFDIDYYDKASTLYLLEVNGNAMVAGRPYVFLPSGTSIEVTYTDGANASAGSFNGLVGSYEEELITKEAGNYILYNNKYYLVDSDAKVGANRAYIHMEDVPTEPSTPQLGAAPRRRIAMTVNGKQTPTGFDELNASEAPAKKVINGQLFILRGEKMYDATGRLVK